MSGIEWIVLGVVTLVGVGVQTTVGFGYAFFVAPVLFLTGSASQAVILLLALGILVNLLMLYGEKRPRGGLRPIVTPMVIWSIPGLAVGYVCLLLVPKEILQILVGMIIVGASLFHVRDVESVEIGPAAGSAALAGLSSGAMTSSIGLNGPTLLLWATRNSSSPNGLRHLVAGGLLALNFLGVLLVTLGSPDGGLGHTGLLFVVLVPMVLLGHQCGKLILSRLDASGHRKIVLVAATLAGSASIAFGGIALI